MRTSAIIEDIKLHVARNPSSVMVGLHRFHFLDEIDLFFSMRRVLFGMDTASQRRISCSRKFLVEAYSFTIQSVFIYRYRTECLYISKEK